MRGHDNPALDVAVNIGNEQGLPVLVYQVLSPDGPYPHPNDRHYRFILEGACDMAMELEQRGITYAFQVADEGLGALPKLVGEAHAVVVEDMPLKWHRERTQGAISSSDGAVYAVDTACVVPSRMVETYCDRAYKFRDQHRPLRKERIHRRWESVEPDVASLDVGELPFEPLAFDELDIAGVLASMDIDHSVGPVGDTVGGSAAAYRRWRRFRDEHLEHYHRVRNDAAKPQSVSRLSAYLHYGMISPFRVARQAAAMAGKGPDKYIEEMVTWREFAHHACAHFDGSPGVDWLPEWAIESLREHADDERDEHYDWERLARGKTGDQLWNLCQKSLLVHGELHNNLRMTWGKQFLRWTPTVERAVELAIDLNDRYGLDGSDPNSYLGILWCFGGWDRPFKPASDIFGTVRARSTERHAGRLNIKAYKKWVGRPIIEPSPRVAVVGAGLAGLMAARILSDHGLSVSVFDKGRTPGGRISTRHSRSGGQFDHGAQYFTARTALLKRYVEAWQERGIVAPYHPRMAVLDADGWRTKEVGTDRYVGQPSMEHVARHLVGDLDIRSAVEIDAIKRGGGQEFEVIGRSCRSLGAYDAVILTPPPPQAWKLCEEVAEDLAERLATVAFQATWAVMVSFESPLGLEVDGVFVNEAESPLGWVCREGSKAGRPEGHRWVLHGSGAWSQRHVEWEPEEAASALVEAFQELVELGGGRWQEPVFERAHRWRFARAVEPLEEGAWVSEDAPGVVVAGDWLSGSRVEGALLSGVAAAGRILNGAAGEAATVQPGLWGGGDG